LFGPADCRHRDSYGLGKFCGYHIEISGKLHEFKTDALVRLDDIDQFISYPGCVSIAKRGIGFSATQKYIL
jgi:hypothetical protein